MTCLRQLLSEGSPNSATRPCDKNQHVGAPTVTLKQRSVTEDWGCLNMAAEQHGHDETPMAGHYSGSGRNTGSDVRKTLAVTSIPA